MTGIDHRSANRKAGLSGLFCLVLLGAVLFAEPAIAEPLKVEVTNADVGFDRRTGEPVLTFTMSEASRKLFAEMTEKNVGRKMAIRIDGRTLTAPVIREPITGGTGQISGNLTERDARDLASRLSSGTSRLELE